VVCVAGAAGGYAVCSHLGVVPLLGFAAHPRHLAASHETATTHQARGRPTSRRVLGDPARPSATPTTTLDTPAPQKLQPRPRPTTAVEQIRREFGAPRARIASSTRAVTTTPTTPARVPTSTETAPPSTPQARQTQAEFGFER